MVEIGKYWLALGAAGILLVASLAGPASASFFYRSEINDPKGSNRENTQELSVSHSDAAILGIADASTTDKLRPWVRITSPAENSQVATTDGLIKVNGIANDRPGGSGVQAVEVRVNSSNYVLAKPISPGNWSSWSAVVNVSESGTYRIVPRVTDNAGNQAWNSIYVTVTKTTPLPESTAGELDKFGIAKLYPTAAGWDNEYYTKTGAATVTEFKDSGRIDRLPTGFSKNADGSWHIPAGTTPRWVINGGWRNVEMTMQLRINSGELVQLYSNGEQHTTSLDGAWHGSANKMRVYADGRMGFVKEIYHESGNSGYTTEIATRNSGSVITGKWVTVKFVGYDIGGSRKFEAYIAINNDNKFVKVAEYIDNGNWLASSRFDAFMSKMRQNYPSYIPHNRDTGQEIKRNEVITWEGDWVSFRSDGADYDFKNVSVREISASNGPDLSFIADTATMPAPLERAFVESAHLD